MSAPTLSSRAAAHFAFDGVVAAAAGRREPVVTTTRIVVGVDGSPASMRAVQWAGRVVPLLGSDVEVEVEVVVGFPEWVYEPAGQDPAGDARTVAQDVVRVTALATCPVLVIH